MVELTNLVASEEPKVDSCLVEVPDGLGDAILKSEVAHGGGGKKEKKKKK